MPFPGCPLELTTHILSLSDVSTLVCTAQVCQVLSAVTIPLLYEELDLLSYDKRPSDNQNWAWNHLFRRIAGGDEVVRYIRNLKLENRERIDIDLCFNALSKMRNLRWVHVRGYSVSGGWFLEQLPPSIVHLDFEYALLKENTVIDKLPVFRALKTLYLSISDDSKFGDASPSIVIPAGFPKPSALSGDWPVVKAILENDARGVKLLGISMQCDYHVSADWPFLYLPSIRYLHICTFWWGEKPGVLANILQSVPNLRLLRIPQHPKLYNDYSYIPSKCTLVFEFDEGDYLCTNEQLGAWAVMLHRFLKDDRHQLSTVHGTLYGGYGGVLTVEKEPTNYILRDYDEFSKHCVML